jgi:hypothetical protein
VLQPIIYGTDGGGGLAGIFKGAFGGKQDPMKMSTDINTAVTAQNSAAVATLTAVLAGAMGMATPAIALPPGIGGISLPSISASAVSGPSSGASSGGGSNAWFAPGGPSSVFSAPRIFGGGGAPSNNGSDYNFGWDTGPAASSNKGSGGIFRSIFGGGSSQQSGSGQTGIAGMLRNFKTMNWGGLTRANDGSVVGYGPDGTPHDDQGNPVNPGRVTGVNGMAGAAMAGTGMMLAQSGLLGANRGTWGGIAEGTAGV